MCDEVPKRELMRQEAPYPAELDSLVGSLTYKDGWSFLLRELDRGQGSKGLTLVITVTTVNSYPPHEPLRVAHYMPVPPAAYDARSWRRWLFDQILLVERHEAAEFYRFPVPPKYDAAANVHLAQPDERPYAPSHGFGQDPYLIREIGTEEDQRMSFRNELNA